MKTINLLFDADKMTVDSANGVFTVDVHASEKDINSILEQIGISNIVGELRDELLDEIGRDYSIDYFNLEME